MKAGDITLGNGSLMKKWGDSKFVGSFSGFDHSSISLMLTKDPLQLADAAI